MKKLIVTCVLVIVGSLLCAQGAPSWLWASAAGGAGDDWSCDLATDDSGNTYVGGSFSGTSSFGNIILTSSGGADAFIGKIDTNGNWLWAKRAGGADHDGVVRVFADNGGNCYITGYFRLSSDFGATTLVSPGERDIFVAKLDTAGNWLWAVRAGGSGNESGYGIIADGSGNVFITGYFVTTANFGDITLTGWGYYNNVFIAKLDPDGNWLWANQAGGIENQCGYDIAIDSNGSLYITGYVNLDSNFGSIYVSSIGASDIFVAKTDPDGNWQWVINAGGASTIFGSDAGNAIAIDSADNLYLSGYYTGTAGFGSSTLTSRGQQDIFVAKLDSSGYWSWATSAGGSSGNDNAQDIALDGSGNIYITGDFYYRSYFGDTLLQGVGLDHDIFVAKLSPTGNWVWAIKSQGNWDDSGYGISALADGTSYVTGYVSISANFGSITPAWNGLEDIFVAKLSPGGVDIADDVQIPPSAFQMRNYPNPFNPETTISYTLPTAGLVSLEIYNSRGQLVRSLLQEEQSAGEHTLIWNGKDDSGHSVASGLYLCRIACNGIHEMRKMLLMK